MRHLLSLTIICLSFAIQANAQEWAFELWHEGKIVLESGDTLRGQVKYDLQQDLIQYKQGQSMAQALTARKVLYFEIFDSSIRKYRQFFSLPYATNTNYKAPVFFELLTEGDLTLLCREALEYRTYSSPYMIGSYTRLVLVNSYFLLKENGSIEPLEVKKADLLNLMGKKSDKVENYMKDNRLKVDDKYDLVQIIKFYNNL
jgi:hypothetical protein